MGEVSREAARAHFPVLQPIAQGDGAHANGVATGAVAVAQRLSAALDLLGELVDHIDSARRVHPADVRVEPLVYEELAPGRRAIGIEALVARHLQLGSE